jgi:hypothetical protein
VKGSNDSSKDFKKRAEEIEAAHLLKVKAETIDTAPNFSVSQVITGMQKLKEKEEA